MDSFDPSLYSTFDHMSNGEWYVPGSEELRQISERAARLGHEYNQFGPTDPEQSREIQREWINPTSDRCAVKAPAVIEYGRGTTISARSMLGPNCQLLTAGHPVNDVEIRNGGWENGAPITIGEDVWLGGGVIVIGGVTTGAGAVVTKDIPEDAIAVGNPARVIRMLDDAHLERDELPEAVSVDVWGEGLR